ncbi:MAG: hypothetical protein DMG05_07480 [Acidobacteria bacterium]|nr:MAG: hypothetical protein DMG05_07480 [Acidobacteriota bacterium]
MQQIRKILNRVFEIREGEFLRTSLMFFYLFLVIASYITSSAVRDSLFLKSLGTKQIPYAYLLIAIVVGLISPFYLRAASKASLNQLIRYTSLAAVLSLLVFWWVFILQFNRWWMLYVFYIWVSIFGAITTSQFWLLANHAFDPREAKRLFALIGAGGVLGGMLGGSFTNYGAQWFGTEWLLLWCAGFMVTSMLLAEGVWKEVTLKSNADSKPRRKSEPRATGENTGRLLKLIHSSRHLSLLTAMLGITVIIDSLTDYQLKYISYHSIGSKDQLTAFFGTLSLYRGIFSFLFQLFLTSRILKGLGVGLSILFLPTSLLLGSLVMVFYPVLSAVKFLKVSDGSLRFSIHRSSIELLYLPIPLEVKNRVKGFIDIFIDRVGLAVGGLLLLLLTRVFALSISQLSLVVCAMVLGWIFLSISIRQEYLNSFRLALEKKTIEPEALRVRITDSTTRDTLTQALQSLDERQVLYAMRLLKDMNSTDWLPDIQPLIKHPSAKVRALSIECLGARQDPEILALVTDRLQDPDLEVRAEAIHYLSRLEGFNSREKIKEFLRHRDYSIVGAAIHSFLNHEVPCDGLIDQEFIEDALAQEGDARDAARIAAACALGLVSPSSSLQRYLKVLLQDPSIEVVRNAIRSAGQTLNPDVLPLLMQKLADRRLRSEAREALLKYGVEIVGILSQYLNDLNQPTSVRANIPKLLSLLGKQEAADVLIQSIRQPDPFLTYRVIKALNRMRVTFLQLSFKHEVIDHHILNDIKAYYQYQAMSRTMKIGESASYAGLQLLHKTIQERMDQSLERAFRLLGLRYPPKDIYSAYNAIRSQKPHLRASAIEFLDNLLVPDQKHLLFPILEESTSDNLIGQRNHVLGLSPKSQSAYLNDLIVGKDPWLRTLGIYVAGSLKLSVLADLVRESLDAPDTAIRETARWSWNRLNNFEGARA